MRTATASCISSTTTALIPRAATSPSTVEQAANTTFAVSAAQLAQTTFSAGSVSDDLFVNAWDGIAYSGPQEFHVNVPAQQLARTDYPNGGGYSIIGSSGAQEVHATVPAQQFEEVHLNSPGQQFDLLGYSV